MTKACASRPFFPGFDLAADGVQEFGLDLCAALLSRLTRVQRVEEDVRPRLRAAVFALALLVTCAHAAKEEFEVSGHDAIDHSHVDHSYYTILFLMVTVGIGGLVHETLHYFHSSIPYTVCILVLGMLVGAAKEAFDFAPQVLNFLKTSIGRLNH